MKHLKLTFSIFLLVIIGACKQHPTAKKQALKGDIENTIINDKNSFYYIDFKNYPKHDNSLPIGVFDSGTGGLTVLKAIVN